MLDCVYLKMMNSHMMRRWEILLATLTGAKKNHLICSEAEIELIEKELGFKFPAGYREYCAVFGSGSLGQGDAPQFFRVYCPCPFPSSMDIRQTGHCLIGLKLDLEASEPIEDDQKAKILYRLLENGYPFGDSDRADSFIWDLTSYREEDQSYDIYWIPDEDAEEITLIGRDFFEFIDKFCLGTKWKIMFPGDYLLDKSEVQERFFSPFEQHNENKSVDSWTESWLAMVWEQLTSGELLTEKGELKLSCGYDAPGKEQAECLQTAWSRDEGVEIEIISPSDRPYIPRLVEITVTAPETQITREFAEGLLRKMISIGKECNCLLTSFGSSGIPKAEE